MTAPVIVRDYLGAILAAASRAHFVLKWCRPEFGQAGCYLFYLPGGVFRAGVRGDPLASLVTAANAVRSDLEARGFRLPARLDVE